MKYSIETNLNISETSEILKKINVSNDINTEFIEFNNKHYVVTSVKSNESISIIIKINENQQKSKKEKYDFSEVSEWLYKEKGLKLGRNNLFKVLRDYEVLNKDNYPLTEKKYLFSENITTYDNGKTSTYQVTFATEDGLNFIYNTLIDKSIKC